MRYTVDAEAVLRASAHQVYALLADYHRGHPRVLPRAFTGLQVIEGGTGAGTVIDVDMKAFGRVRRVRAYVAEPEPGRVLEERYPTADIVTRFYITPLPDARCTVRIWSELNSKGGWAGWVERRLVRRYLAKLYREELTLIEKVAAE